MEAEREREQTAPGSAALEEARRIEKGWTVYDAAGAPVGNVADVGPEVLRVDGRPEGRDYFEVPLGAVRAVRLESEPAEERSSGHVYLSLDAAALQGRRIEPAAWTTPAEPAGGPTEALGGLAGVPTDPSAFAPAVARVERLAAPAGPPTEVESVGPSPAAVPEPPEPSAREPAVGPMPTAAAGADRGPWLARQPLARTLPRGLALALVGLGLALLVRRRRAVRRRRLLAPLGGRLRLAQPALAPVRRRWPGPLGGPLGRQLSRASLLRIGRKDR
jgi:hypothetical protein